MVSTLDTKSSHINVYYSYISDHTSIADQICTLIHIVHHANVDKQQINGHDCGVYTIAFATSLCYGQDVISTHYDSQ